MATSKGATTPLSLVPKEVPVGLENYTAIALKALDEARAMVLKADTAGKPCTHLVVCMVAEYVLGKEQRMTTQMAVSDLCSDLAVGGVLDLCMHDHWG